MTYVTLSGGYVAPNIGEGKQVFRALCAGSIQRVRSRKVSIQKSSIQKSSIQKSSIQKNPGRSHGDESPSDESPSAPELRCAAGHGVAGQLRPLYLWHHLWQFDLLVVGRRH